MGNLMEKSIKEIWFDARYVDIRKELRQGKAPLEICRRCLGAGRGGESGI
jgi:MoaA/NifB/PqqE/SkfB family radical SAM enzyme